MIASRPMLCDTCHVSIVEEGLAWDGGRWCSHQCAAQLDLFTIDALESL